MIPTLSTLAISSWTALNLLPPVQVVTAAAAVVYGIGGLVALRIVENRARASEDPVRDSRPSFPPFKAAA